MDIRKPIGQLFLLLGVILMVWGIIGEADSKDSVTITISLNLVWGSCVTLFGGIMAWLSRATSK